MNLDEKRFERIESLLESLVAEKSFNTPVPLPLREAALVTHVELRTLQDWVNRKWITAYRNAEGHWRVFPKDIQTFVMSETNLAPARRVRILKRAA